MKYTMVIADDEPIVRCSMEMFVKKEFPEIEIVGIGENGIELKQLLERHRPDLAIVDIRMPGLSGIEVIELMRARGIKTHFIINTAFSDFDYIKKALDLKTDGYILKPGRREEKIKVISDLCRTIQYERESSKTETELKAAIHTINPYLGSEILLSVFSESCDEKSFDVYTKLNGLTFDAGCIATFLYQQNNKLDNRKLNRALKEILEGLCDFLAAVTKEGAVVMLFIPEFRAEGRQESFIGEICELIKKTIEELTGALPRSGVGQVYKSFPEMLISYRESIEMIQRREDTTDIPMEAESDNADKIEAYVSTAKNYIERRFASDISLLDCAEYVGISSYYLSHIFREKTDRTFIEYLTEVRMQHARELCKNSKLTVAEIAGRCGYLNTTYFCKVFKRNIGETITQYRKNKDNNTEEGA